VPASLAPSLPPATAVPGSVHRKSLIGFRAGCEQIWGPDYEALCSVSSDVRERTSRMRPLPEWIALYDLIAWHHAVWAGPARRDERVMKQQVRATVDHGFGRVKRFLLSISTPETLAPRVAALWRDEYSTGRLEATLLDGPRVKLTLTDHPYVQDHLMRFVMAEVFRHVLSLTKANGVTADHGVSEDALVVLLRWI